MKTIVCYGDSNTWGYDPRTGRRFDRDTRWPGVLAKELGSGYQVIEEGLSGRTTVWNDPVESLDDGSEKNGKFYLKPCLDTHAPIDLLIIMLGTNDLKTRFSLSAHDIARGAGTLVQIAHRSGAGQEWKKPPVLLIAPTPVHPDANDLQAWQGSYDKSTRFAEEFGYVARENKAELLDAGAVITTSTLDKIHLEAPEHAKLGKAVAVKVRQIIG